MDISQALSISKFRAKITGKITSAIRMPPEIPRTQLPLSLVKFMIDSKIEQNFGDVTKKIFDTTPSMDTLKAILPSLPVSVTSVASTRTYIEKIQKTKNMFLERVGNEPLSRDVNIIRDDVGFLTGHIDYETPTQMFIIRTSNKFKTEWSEFVLQLFCYVAMSPKEYQKFHIILPLQQCIFSFDNSSFPKKADVLKEMQTYAFVERSPMQLAFCETVMELYPVGLHIPKARLLSDTVEKIKGSDRPYQFFMTMNTHMNYTNDDIEKCNIIVKTHNSKIYIHSPYLLNLCINPGDKNDYVFECLKHHIIVGSKCGFKGIVVHVGKSTSTPLVQALANMKINVGKLNDLPESKICPLLIETPAGQGTETLTEIMDFVDFVSEFDNVGICIDTCHVFACGYQPSDYIKTFINGETPIRSKLKLLHYNDSSDDFGSKKDRHARVGCGKISHQELKMCADIAVMYGIDMVHE